MADNLVNLLFVDDDEDILELQAEVASNMADSNIVNSVFQVLSSKKALEIIDQEKIDIVFTDIKMPEDDGLTLLKKIKNRNSNIIVLLVSGYTNASYAITAIKENAFDFIEKPISTELLEAAIIRAHRQKLLNDEVEITRKKSLQIEKLASLGTMSASIAHEIANPLTVIKGFSKILLTEFAKNQKGLTENVSHTLSNHIQTIRKMSVRIEDIINSLKNISRDTTEKIENVPLKFIFDDAFNICNCKIKEKEINLSFPPLSEDIKLTCNRVEISQVLINLINNSCQAIEELAEKWVRIDFKSDSNFLTIGITDSGSGIPKEIEDKIFKEFFTTKPIGVGTGFGLSLSLKTIESHNGSIKLDKTCKNTRFEITLPHK